MTAWVRGCESKLRDITHLFVGLALPECYSFGCKIAKEWWVVGQGQTEGSHSTNTIGRQRRTIWRAPFKPTFSLACILYLASPSHTLYLTSLSSPPPSPASLLSQHTLAHIQTSSRTAHYPSRPRPPAGSAIGWGDSFANFTFNKLTAPFGITLHNSLIADALGFVQGFTTRPDQLAYSPGGWIRALGSALSGFTVSG